IGAFWLIGTYRGTTGKVTTGAWESLGLTGARAVGLGLAAATVGFAIASLGRHTATALGVGLGYAPVVEIGSLIVFGAPGLPAPPASPMSPASTTRAGSRTTPTPATPSARRLAISSSTGPPLVPAAIAARTASAPLGALKPCSRATARTASALISCWNEPASAE